MSATTTVASSTTTTTTTTAQPLPQLLEEHPTSRRVYVRDVITIDADFQTRVAAIASGFSTGTPLTFVARRIKHAVNKDTKKPQELRLQGHPLVFIADEYDGIGGAIDTSGTAGAAGQAGNKGAPGKALAQNSKPGGPGSAGKPGSPGQPGTTVTIIARSVRNLRVSAVGGAGGKGGAGGEGGDGAQGKTTAQVDLAGSPGGKGGAGGDAAMGGGGARITVVTIAQPVALQLTGAGGAAGVKGKGGKGGKSGDGPTPPNGPDGKPASAGATVAPTQSIVASGEWWSQARSALGPFAWQWADHRMRVGRYAWRAQGDIPASVIEFNAAITLSGHDEAGRLRRYIDAGVTPMGVPYKQDLRPDFSFYEKVVIDYGALVLELALAASQLLQQALSAQQAKQLLVAQAEHIRELEKVKQNGVLSAEAGIEYSVLEGALADKQVSNAIGELIAVRKSMEPDHDAWKQFLGVATAIVAIVGAAYSGGATLAALPAAFGLIGDATKILESKIFDPKKGEYSINGKSLDEWKGSKEYKDMTGGLSELAANAKTFYENVTVIAELGDKPADPALVKQEKELLRRIAELEFQRRLLSLKRIQADLALDSAKQIQKVATADAKAIDNLKDGFEKDKSVLASLSLRLMRNARAHLDIHTKYVFLAARALDLYTLQDKYAAEVDFSLGYVHPDIEEEALYRVGTGDTQQFTQLLVAYHTSLSKMPALQLLRDAWGTYHESLSEVHHQVWDFTDQRTLDAFRANNEVSLRVPLSSIPKTRTELKVTQVYVSLAGAVSLNSSILVEVEHSGSAENRTKAGKAVHVSATPLRAIMGASKDQSAPATDQNVPFWGRSPAAMWRLKIDAAELVDAAGDALDLSGLSEIQLTMDYKFVAAAGT